ncbi:MAG: ABC transporter ATP-binding protein [Proteobacteria bacterium]|nr:ABC transporter ATP-binding protein [Pseudomonadota bacterium]
MKNIREAKQVKKHEHLDQSFDNAQAGVVDVRSLIALAWSERGRFLAAALCMGISALATAGYAYLIGPVLRSVFLGADAERLQVPVAGFLARLSASIGAADPWMIGAAIVSVTLIKGVSYFSQTALTGQAGQRVLHGLRTRLYRGLLGLNPLNSNTPTRGELITRFTVDVEAVEKAVTDGLVAFVRDGLQILALAGLALALDPLLGLIGIAAFPPVAVLIVRVGGRLRNRRAAVHTAFGNMGTAIDETASGLSVIQSFGAEKMMESRFNNRSQNILVSTVRAIVLKAISSPINELLGATALAVTLWYAHDRIAAGALSPEAFVSFFSALLLLYQPVKGLGQAQHAVQAGLAAFERLVVLTDLEKEQRDNGSVTRAIPEQLTEICLENVKVAYDRGENVLRNVNLTISAGSRIAVVGRSGAGKTTLLNFLMGFLPLGGGRLLLDGESVDLESGMARQIFAPVPQEPYLFDDTIKMNVHCGRPRALDSDVLEACRAAGVTQFADEMERGICTRVGPGGEGLSLGQRQRVCLARAILSRAPVLLLDEVTASLDGETEQALVEGLESFIAGRTVLVVTHRLATARWADQIALIENGTISSIGEADTILSSNERLKKLFAEQYKTGPS